MKHITTHDHAPATHSSVERTQAKICANHCTQAVGGECCDTCYFANTQTSRDAEREDAAFEIQQTLNACRKGIAK